jgi:hypothetical protein
MMQLYPLVIVLFVLGLSACSTKPMPEALESAKQAQQEDDYYLFEAESPTTDTCYIYYPGGLVNAEAYAPYATEVAAAGTHTFLLRLTLDLAMLDVDAAEDAKQSEFAKANCKNFVLGGHSLGGIGIALYGAKHPQDGLLFISSYAHKEDLVNNHQGPVMVVSASNDLLATKEEIEEAKVNLPATAQYSEATISRQQQQQQLVVLTMDLIGQMKTNNN